MSGDDHFIRPDNDVTDPAFLHTIQVFGQGEFVNAEHARNVIGELRRNLRHWREECGKLHAQLVKAKADLQSWETTAQRIQEAEANKSFDDGSCLRCGAAPRNASGLCATCVDEDAVRAGEIDIEECGNHSAGSPP